MNKFIKPLCAILSLTLLCSCTAREPKAEPKASETKTETITQYEEPKTSVSPEPMGSNDKKSHSYGVAKNGVANEISINAQKYFESNNFKAFCLDTKSQKKILDVLKEKNVNAAFFCTLPQVKENPDLIQRMIDEGHIVGNHSVTHPSFAEISTEQIKDEILGMDNYLRENFNYSEPYFRFPKGEYNENALNTVGSLGYTSVFWSLAYADWDLNNQKGTDYAYETVVSRLHPGAVILLHSVSPDNANALAQIIDKAREDGYEFCSLRDYNN